MTALKVTIKDIIAIKELMNEVDSLKDRSFAVNGYSENNGNKVSVIDGKENKITENVKIVASLLKIDFDSVIDMCYDLELAKRILENN
jgi:hypothetical protein